MTKVSEYASTAFVGLRRHCGQVSTQTIFLAGYDCFRRTEEMCLLRVEDVAFEQGRATRKRGRGRRDRCSGQGFEKTFKVISRNDTSQIPAGVRTSAMVL
jgi:hypothetical protein